MKRRLDGTTSTSQKVAKRRSSKRFSTPWHGQSGSCTDACNGPAAGHTSPHSGPQESGAGVQRLLTKLQAAGVPPCLAREVVRRAVEMQGLPRDEWEAEAERLGYETAAAVAVYQAEVAARAGGLPS